MRVIKRKNETRGGGYGLFGERGEVKLRERDHLKDRRVDYMIILKGTFSKYNRAIYWIHLARDREM